MNETAYVLMQDHFILGVFDSPDFPQCKLDRYFGKCEIIKFIDVDESGIKWIAELNTLRDGIQKLTMMYFGVNEIE